MNQNRPISMLLSQINTYQILQTVSLFYIALPTILFIGGWLSFYISIPLILLILLGLFKSLFAAWSYNPGPIDFFQVKDLSHVKLHSYLTYTLIFLLIIFMGHLFWIGWLGCARR